MRIKEFRVEDYNFSNRKFQLLFYQISHGEMIIRSNKNDTSISFDNYMIDIYFGDVIYIEIPRDLNGVIFRRPNADDVRYINSKVEKEISEDKIIVILSNKKKYYVAASIISVIKHNLMDMELPIHCFLYDKK